MRPKGTAAELEQRRRLAALRLDEGWTRKDVAAFLGVSLRTVERWAAAAAVEGDGLKAKPRTPRPALTPAQEAEVLGWLREKPSAFGFPTELWTCKRLAQLMRQRLGVSLHPRYLPEWLRKRRYSRQKPELHARERDPVKIGSWPADDRERLKKKPPRRGPTSC